MKQNKRKKVFLLLISIFLIATFIVFYLNYNKYIFKADESTPSSNSLLQLQAVSKPNYKPGHTLPRLSYWLGGNMSADTQKELTENWGYSYAIILDDANWLGNPNSANTKIADLVVSDPDRYPLHIITRHYWGANGTYVRPESMWCHLDGVNGTPATRVLSDEDGLTLSVGLDSDDMEVVVNKELSATLKTWFEWETETFNRPSSGWIQIENEIMTYSSFTGNKFIISSRGAYGTTPMAHIVGKPIKDKPVKIYSPEAPISIFEATGANWSEPIRQFLAYYPTIKAPIIINGTEYGLGVIAGDGKMWKQDIGVLAARDAYNTANGIAVGSWFQYISDRKAKQELPIANAFRSADPNATLYVHYGDSAGATPDYISSWGYDFKNMKPVTDLPAIEFYYAYGNTWSGVLNTITRKIGLQIAEDRPLTYDFLSAGWRTTKNTLATGINADSMTLTGSTKWEVGMPTSGWLQIDNEIIKYENMVTNDDNQKTITITQRGVDGSTIPNTSTSSTSFLGPTVPAAHSANAEIYKLPQYGLSDPNTYMGFLKTNYVLGNIGACYFYGVPKENDPHWLWQFEYAGHAHALFSWLEDYLRNGDLLPGDGQNSITASLPSYEFATGDSTAHVVARKKQTSNDWLISAWAQAGTDRDVTVTIPVLDTVTVNARLAGSVYTAKLDSDGKPVLTLIDIDALNPTDGISGRVDDGVTPPAPVPNMNRTFTYKSKVTLSGAKSDLVTNVLVNNAEAVINNDTDTWSLEYDLNFGVNTFTIIGRDDTDHLSSTVTRTITRRKMADANNDNNISIIDFGSLMSNWLKQESNNPADFNEDGSVNLADFGIMMSSWGG